MWRCHLCPKTGYHPNDLLAWWEWLVHWCAEHAEGS